jgi:hypothetical protein
MSSSRDLYLNLRNSLLRYLTDKSVELRARGFDVQVVNFDTFAEDTKLPDGDLFGAMSLSLVADPEIEANVRIGFGVFNDPNLDRLTEMISNIANDFIPGAAGRIPIYDSNTGEPIGNLVPRALSVLPVASTYRRPFQFLDVELGADASFR